MNGSVRVTFGNTATQKPTLSLITRGNCCWPRHGKQLIADCLAGWLDAGRFAVSKAINDLRAPRGWRPSPKWWTVLAFHPPPPSANEQGSSLWLHESWWTREQSDFLKRKRRTHIELFSPPLLEPGSRCICWDWGARKEIVVKKLSESSLVIPAREQSQQQQQHGGQWFLFLSIHPLLLLLLFNSRTGSTSRAGDAQSRWITSRSPPT